MKLWVGEDAVYVGMTDLLSRRAVAVVVEAGTESGVLTSHIS